MDWTTLQPQHLEAQEGYTWLYALQETSLVLKYTPALSTSRSFRGPSEPWPTKADLGGKVQLHGQGHTRVTGMMLDHVCPIFSFGSLGPRSKEHTDSGRVAEPFPTPRARCPRPCLPLPPRPPRGTAARGLQLGGFLKDCSNLDLFP